MSTRIPEDIRDRPSRPAALSTTCPAASRMSKRIAADVMLVAPDHIEFPKDINTG